MVDGGYLGLSPYHDNLAERDERPMKIRENIRGTFRNEECDQPFCASRGAIPSARKQERPIFVTLASCAARLPKASGPKGLKVLNIYLALTPVDISSTSRRELVFIEEKQRKPSCPHEDRLTFK